MTKKHGSVRAWATSLPKQRELPAAWRSWPQAALGELAEVVTMMDAGEARVTVHAMLGRLRDVHGVVATRHQLETWCMARGRTSWTSR